MSPPSAAAGHPVDSYPGAVVVHASGDLDAVAGSGFRRAVQAAASGGAPLVVVDMAQVGFLDSAGLSALFGVHRQLPAGQRLALANVPRRMQRVLQITAVGTLLLVHEQGPPWPWPDLIPEPSPAAP